MLWTVNAEIKLFVLNYEKYAWRKKEQHLMKRTPFQLLSTVVVWKPVAQEILHR